jgi:hypothetical protein
MANIDVVRKRNTVWIWVIALIVLALVLVWFFVLGQAPDRPTAPVSELFGPTLTRTTAAVA